MYLDTKEVLYPVEGKLDSENIEVRIVVAAGTDNPDGVEIEIENGGRVIVGNYGGKLGVTAWDTDDRDIPEAVDRPTHHFVLD